MAEEVRRAWAFIVETFKAAGRGKAMLQELVAKKALRPTQ